MVVNFIWFSDLKGLCFKASYLFIIEDNPMSMLNLKSSFSKKDVRAIAVEINIDTTELELALASINKTMLGKEQVVDVLYHIAISTHTDDEFKSAKKLNKAQKQQLIESLTKEMKAAAKLLEFEHAAYLRDKIKKLRGEK